MFEIGFGSWQIVAGLLGGMAVALVAHRKHGYMPSVFLVGHMIIEWYHYALHGSHYDSTVIAFHGIHAMLDVVFLYLEAKAHYSKYAFMRARNVSSLSGVRRKGKKLRMR